MAPDEGRAVSAALLKPAEVCRMLGVSRAWVTAATKEEPNGSRLDF